MDSSDTAPAGFLLPSTNLVLRPAGEEWLLLDSRGDELARFEPRLARALAQRTEGGEATAPLLDALARVTPKLREALDDQALPLTPAALLRRTGWGQLFVELTAKCNERCVHCYATSSPERTEALDRPTVEAVIRDAAELGFEVLQFTGGEALLCAFLPEVARQAKEAGIPTVEVYTNAVLLDERRYAALRDAGVSFAVSLYAADPEAHDAITRLPGSHRRTVQGIRRAVEGGSTVRVSALVTRPGDDAHALAAMDLAEGLGVPRIRIGGGGTTAVGRGQQVAARLPAAQPVDRHALVEGGKAAVLPDGWVTPCIFSRELRLGRVGPEGGLRAALERPRATLREAACAADLTGPLRQACSRLTCAGCRIATGLLRPSP